MAIPSITRQERALQEAQKRLERLDKIREQMVKQVELEMKRLEKMREIPDDFTQAGGTQPGLSNTAPSGFQSQYDQYQTDKTIEKLAPTIDGAIRFPGLMRQIDPTAPYYQHGDRDEHWSVLTENPGKQVYVSGKYISSEHGTHQLNSNKEYEYELSARALPISVSDVLVVPAHPTGHGDGRMKTTSLLQYQVTDIYTKKKFYPYHDTIEA